MKSNDADLIQQTIDGNDKAFAALVEKYQKQIHALAWQKIGDFHVAQEITQDTFLTAYQKLETLKHYNRFAGWLYVIADRKCKNWFRKKRLNLRSLEDTDPVELEEVYYSEYMTQQREDAVNNKRRAIVQKLLSQLKESERTVINLYYIAEMTCEDIGKFLGVAPNTVRSRLHRARNRLKKEESMIKENLSSFHLPTQLTENIMQKITELKPIVPSTTKPLLPIAISAASAIFVLLLIGIGAQNLFHFQEPYSLNAQTAPTIEITEAQLVIDNPEKPTVQAQSGNLTKIGQGNGIDQNSDTTLFAAQSSEDEAQRIKGDWVQTKGPEGGPVRTLFNSTQGELYAGTDLALYKLSNDEQRWDLISSNLPFKSALQMIEREDTFYVVSYKEIFTSIDKGKTWISLGARPEGKFAGMALTDKALYLALEKSVYQSKDSGKTWNVVSKELKDKKIRAITAIDNSVFIGTDSGLYRLKSDTWQLIPVDGKVNSIRSVASADYKLYVGEGVKEKNRLTSEFMQMMTTAKPSLLIFCSTNLGKTWEKVELEKRTMKNPRKGSYSVSSNSVTETSPTIKTTSYQDNLLVCESEYGFCINDGKGNIINFPESLVNTHTPPAVAILNDNQIYAAGNDGVYRTNNAGKTWQKFNTGMANSYVKNLVAVNDSLYANNGNQLVTSSDGGESWLPIAGRTGQIISLVESNGVLYARGTRDIAPHLYRKFSEENRMSSVPDIPAFSVPDFNSELSKKMSKALLETLHEDGKKNLENEKKIDPMHFNAEKFNEIYNEIIPDSLNDSIKYLVGSFVIENSTVYIEFSKVLLRWKPGESKWYNTQLIDETDYDIYNNHNINPYSSGFKIAVSGQTVYVGKRDGNLMLSFDEGDNWNDVTSKLPFTDVQFNDITIAGNTVYVATDKGVVRSKNGIEWQIITDTEGVSPVVDRFAVEDSKVFGQVGKLIFQIEEKTGKWKQVTPEIPYQIACFDVDGQTLYVGTLGSGVHRFTLEE